jgi:hypothetical protein
MIHIPPQLFALGRLMITRRAQAVLDEGNESAWTFLFTHGSGSWVSEDCREQFEEAAENDEEIISFHATRNGADIAVRTNEGHTQTVVMLGEEVEWRLARP